MKEPDAYVTGADRPYWEGLVDGRLILPRCGSCGRWQWPALWRCGECGSWNFKWHKVAPKGVIYSWTRTHHVFSGLEALDYPFVSAVVGLPDAGGVRLLGILENDDPEIGMQVQGAVGKTLYAGEEFPALRWRAV